MGLSFYVSVDDPVFNIVKSNCYLYFSRKNPFYVSLPQSSLT